MDPYKWLPVSKPAWAVEGFAVSLANVGSAIVEAASTATPAKFSTGRGNTNVSAIESQVEALQSFYDVYALYSSSTGIFGIVKTTLDTLISQYTEYSDLTYTGKPTIAIKTDLLDSNTTIANVVDTYNAYRATTLAINIRTAVNTENLPREVYTNTYVQARKYIQDADISGVLTNVTRAIRFLVASAYTSLNTSYSTLPITGTGETAGAVRATLKETLITIINALITKYNTEAPATESTLPTDTTIVDGIAKRTDILAKWATLLTKRISEVTTLIGDPTTTSEGTYQSARNSADSGCVAPYSDIGMNDCWSNASIAIRKGEVKTRTFARDTTSGFISYNNTLLSEYDIVNNVFTTFNTARNNLLIAVNDLTYAALTDFRTAYAALSGYLPTSYTNQTSVDKANADSAPATGTDAKTSTDGQNIYNATNTSPSLSSIKTKYQDATRFLYNAVLANMDTRITTYNRLINRYESFRQDREINMLYRNFTGETLTQVALGTNPADYGLAAMTVTPTIAQVTNLQTVAAEKLGTADTSYTSLTASLLSAVQGKLRLFFAETDRIAEATGYTYTSPTAEIAEGQTPTLARLIEIMDIFAGAETAVAGAPQSADIGLQQQGQSAVSAAITTFYKDTYLPFVRYLSSTAANATAITTAVSKSLQYAVNADGTAKAFADLSGSDTFMGLKTVIDAGMIAFVQALVDGYRTTRDTWIGRGIPVKAVVTEAVQVDVGNVVTVRNTFSGATYWPQLISDIQAYSKGRIQEALAMQKMLSSSKETSATVAGVSTKGLA